MRNTAAICLVTTQAFFFINGITPCNSFGNKASAITPAEVKAVRGPVKKTK